MIVFKTFLKILNKNKMIVILYTAILLVFAGFNIETNETSMSFTPTKPDIYIILEDEEEGLTKNLIDFLDKNSNHKTQIKNLDDALFYRDINMIIKIPYGYRKSILNKKPLEIEIKSTKDYQASLMELLLKKYLNVQELYLNIYQNESDLINHINETLKKEISFEITTKLDTLALEKAKYYYNFSNYAILAGLIYVVCLILCFFKEENIQKRTIISSMNYKKFNRILLLSNALFAIGLWFLYVILSFIFVGNIMFSLHGLFYILNSLIFCLCALSIAFFIGNTIKNKDAINGIVNVIALGSSFLCGAFVPVEFLPKSVISFSKILPSYWFINTNELLSSMEKIEFFPLLFNFFVIILFTILFIILSNIISWKKRKI